MYGHWCRHFQRFNSISQKLKLNLFFLLECNSLTDLVKYHKSFSMNLFLMSFFVITLKDQFYPFSHGCSFDFWYFVLCLFYWVLVYCTTYIYIIVNIFNKCSNVWAKLRHIFQHRIYNHTTKEFISSFLCSI